MVELEKIKADLIDIRDKTHTQIIFLRHQLKKDIKEKEKKKITERYTILFRRYQNIKAALYHINKLLKEK